MCHGEVKIGGWEEGFLFFDGSAHGRRAENHLADQNVKKSIEIADYVYVLQLGQNSREGPKEEFAPRLPEIIKEWI